MFGSFILVRNSLVWACYDNKTSAMSRLPILKQNEYAIECTPLFKKLNIVGAVVWKVAHLGLCVHFLGTCCRFWIQP